MDPSGRRTWVYAELRRRRCCSLRKAVENAVSARHLVFSPSLSQLDARNRPCLLWFICWALSATPVKLSSVISKRSLGFGTLLFRLIIGLLFLKTLMDFKSLKTFRFPSMASVVQILETQCWWLKSKYCSHNRNFPPDPFGRCQLLLPSPAAARRIHFSRASNRSSVPNWQFAGGGC